MEHLENPDSMTHQRRLIVELQEKQALRGPNGPEGQANSGLPPDMHPPVRALNFVTGWDATAAGYIILTPTIISVFVAVIWPAVAVLKYEADVQTSVQTGFAAAGYIVTTG